MSLAIDFELLGSLTARQNDRPIPLGPAKQQCVLAVLLIDANRVVPMDALIDRVWHDEPPRSGRAVLYSYVARIRRLLEDPPGGGTGLRIVRSAGGYLAELDPARVDLHRFHDLLASARSQTTDPQRAGARYRRALALWRGEPLLGLAGAWADSVREALTAERTAALIDCHAAELAAGHHLRLLPELETAATDRPYDETTLRHLMTALHRSGRGAEAVARYDRARRILVAELGVDPSPESRSLYEELLRTPEQDHPGGAPWAELHPIARPAQLPRINRNFTGRRAEMLFLETAVGEHGGSPGQAEVVVLEGMAGTGKTALALHWAHRAKERFPDGQLYVNLHGRDPERPALSPSAALARCLRQLGLAPTRLPEELDELAALWRTVVARRRILLVLDDATSAAQVRPLLPGCENCVTVVTSRGRLDELVVREDAHRLTVTALPAVDAVELLGRLTGRSRIECEPEAVRRIVRACARLPYALQVLAARLERRPGLPLAVVAARLEDDSPLDVLSTDSADPTSVRALLDTSVQSLPRSAQLALGRLGQLPATPFDAAEFAARTRYTAGEAAGILGALAQEHLVDEEGAAPEYTVPHLVRCYAAERQDRARRLLAAG
ncbi:BTAD domain-containing putative transcriptional regulator [Kitasatospora sp. NPDC056327]|uniref:AfsR/SARP family transcriptional regulator n=1 Tax=Kitasatospora sp. NPDC056327 TaxID=3345785 RepID=UPI0035DD83D9